MKKYVSILCIFAIISGLFLSCKNQNNEYATSEIFVMNTIVSQKVYGKNREKAIESVEAKLKELENELSLYISDSDVNKINEKAGIEPVKVNDYTFDLIKTAKEYCELSRGIFDITIAPIAKLWGITSENPKVPQQQEIDNLLPLVNYNNVILDSDKKTVFLKEKGMEVDLGGIAKGYVNDAIKNIYDELEIPSALLSIGGNVFAYHTKPDNSLYTVGIRDPQGTPNDIVGKLEIKDKILSTSGAYERFFEQDGKIYHHILDTKTGYPAESDLLSVTVISEDGGLSDFLSTTLFIAGKQYINQYINHDKFSVIVIDKENNVYVSDNLKGSFELTNDKYKLSEGN